MNHPTNEYASGAPLTRYAWVSIGAAVFTIGLKATAYWLTGSVGLLSDALESIVNLIRAVVALVMLTIAARPADGDHAYGHSKAEYFSSGTEGSLILVAALSIAWTAIDRLLHPFPLEQVGLGVGVSVVASLINLVVAQVLLRASRKHKSITLEASAEHLMTDVWTSVGVLVGVGAVALTGWLPLDSLVALAVAANIVFSGVKIVRKAVAGLMDSAIPEEDLEVVRAAIAPHLVAGVTYHALRTRLAGVRRFVSFHVLVPGEWPVLAGHQLLERIEADIRKALPGTTVFTHLEAAEDPTALEDTQLDREGLTPSS